jgi:hypothetical protein
VIVYGDRSSRCRPSRALATLRRDLTAVGPMGPGRARHERLVALLLAAGELAQGIADHDFESAAADHPTAASGAAMRLTMALARLVWRSHRSGYAALGALTTARARLQELTRQRLPRALTVRVPEGYAHYAVYPEAFADAAAALGRGFRPLVVGVRTIGLSLAAMVAAACGARAPLTVRPVGHPFNRALALSPVLLRRLRRSHRRTFAVVDEGPGLSGSSFAAAVGALTAAGAAPARIHLFPSHAGFGAITAPATRALLESVPRHCLTFETCFLGDGPRGLAAWAAPVTGALTAPPEDLGGGRWRRHCCGDVLRWPPVQVANERRKYLLRGSLRTALAKFAGLGRHGDARHRRAKLLAAAGFSPPVLALCHGFLVHPWLADAVPLPEAGAAIPRRVLVERVGAYLAFRAELTAEQGSGASPAQLLAMATANAAEALGEPARALDRLAALVAPCAARARPVEIDGRLSAWKWLVTSTGELLKVDAVDHCDSHDLIGCQDIAWDLAGAAVELALTAQELDGLRRRLRRSGAPVPREALTFYQVCYLAFQLGAHRMAAQASASFDAAEAARLETAVHRYAALLERLCQRIGRAEAPA